MTPWQTAFADAPAFAFRTWGYLLAVLAGVALDLLIRHHARARWAWRQIVSLATWSTR